MNEQVKKYIDPIKTFWVNLTKKRKIIIISGMAGVILIAVIAAYLLNRQPLVVLYPGLEHEEAVAVMTELGNRGVAYEEKNGTISVPKNQENSLRMDLANMGYPKSGPNYDFFTKNTDVMTTDYEKKTIEKFQLNQRLEDVIGTLDGVKKANVTISIPEENTYAWSQDSAKATASVSITMYGENALNTKQVNGIKQLVSKSVPNLTTENVVVIDTASGEELGSTSDGSSSQVDISQFKRTIEKAYENDVESSVMKVLGPVFGANNVGITAKSVMDVDKKVQEIITYKPSAEGSNTGIVSESSQTTQQERANGGAGGAAGAETNSDVTTYPGVKVDGNTIYAKDEKSYKYLVSQVKEQVQGDAASIKDLTISVVINQEMMNDTQKTQITDLVAHAAAIDSSKVAVYNAPFAEKPATPANANGLITPEMTRILIFVGIGAAALLLLIIILLAVTKSRKRKMVEAEGEEISVPEEFYELTPVSSQNPEEEAEEDPEALAREKARKEAEDALRSKREALEALEKSREVRSGKEEVLRGKLKDFASQNPEIAAQLIRTWLRGDDFNE
ncbi:MAG: flagellar basal-body MS-ring/collar protein FliF [Clostridium sp.]|uniref:flagellar basal-body MS-ring/collar protein FliF n=1 Tax=Clostridium sp. TaxID=1506 RepID=UPI00290B7FE1|nr:flagellar basal-body MS-ring/collar protein FliF [Clostridium sp.]MDU7336988.1 flagellar basal-body MS-ring/collar protein FliF [Clostridium sp.]